MPQWSFLHFEQEVLGLSLEWCILENLDLGNYNMGGYNTNDHIGTTVNSSSFNFYIHLALNYLNHCHHSFGIHCKQLLHNL